MDTHKFRKPNQNIERFKASILTDRPAMDSIRNTMSDTSYGKLWGISGTTVLKYMWYVDKHLYNGMPRVELDAEATNKLRWTYRDWEIARMLNCSNASIQKYCGTRRDNWIPHISISHIVPDIIPTLPPALKRIHKEVTVWLNQDRWETKVDVPYWDQSDTVELYNWPHKYLYEKLG